MQQKASNIVLVGMPGAGKSTVGVLMAKELAKDFVDTDLLIQAEEGRCLQDIVDTDGYMELRRIEERVLSGIDLENHVISTGGSAVYSPKSMENLRRNGTVVFLDVSLGVLQDRVKDFSTRGLAKSEDQSFEDLFEERMTLYRKYADFTVNCDELNQGEACSAVVRSLPA